MACRLEKWREDPYYGKVAVVRAGNGYVVGDFTGWLPGAFKNRVDLPPGLYYISDKNEACAVEPPEYPWHFPVPYMAADWGDVVELRIYAPEPPEVAGGDVVELLRGDIYNIYLGVSKRRRYQIRCCGRVLRFKSPPRPRGPGIYAMYEVLPDRAADRTRCKDLKRDFCGGTLKDAAQLAIDASSFADALYLHPIYPAMSYHRYDVVDHFQVDERLGGWDSFRALREALKNSGMGLVLDVVLYHVGLRNSIFPDGPFIIRDLEFAKLVKALSERLPRYALSQLLAGEPPYETFPKAWLMPRLDYGNRAAVEYARRVIEHWTPHVDGFRLDVAHGIPPEVWAEVLAPASALYVLGEHVGNPAPFYKAIKGFTAYILYRELIQRLAGDVENLVRGVNRYIALTPPHALPYMNTFLENHDTDRAATLLGGLEPLFKGYALLYSLPGVPSIYAGGECGESGKSADHTNRKPYRPCPGHPIARALTQLYRARRLYSLWRGPAWAVAKRGKVVVMGRGVKAEIGAKRAVISNTEKTTEIIFKNSL
ncbi:alpha-amylase family glycosyl hydrolase [Pyrobaculum aerophilum]|uniref:Alpha-amylase n=1 Tax=Pyrobaculum aerophilum TaxID=13773 RepID=A0A371QWU5_9CREN|nr:alpha-amylase family glycosyl hydrolase [Pyrobaculum aerophilum]RFA94603.1 alpha-amylase [Pyrobaculum aerophilum]RFA94861.1 alpha-amylase [Pyrobaculum aerophilum]